ncbi:hypothetical protein BSKO_14150 [Bryopsis sp. KO-2023]|nr:hypothetical protein BSKO_14150 [Bryopsis sp. KO-2023]
MHGDITYAENTESDAEEIVVVCTTPTVGIPMRQPVSVIFNDVGVESFSSFDEVVRYDPSKVLLQEVSPGWWLNSDGADFVSISGQGLETTANDLPQCLFEPIVGQINMEQRVESLMRQSSRNALGACSGWQIIENMTKPNFSWDDAVDLSEAQSPSDLAVTDQSIQPLDSTSFDAPEVSHELWEEDLWVDTLDLEKHDTLSQDTLCSLAVLEKLPDQGRSLQTVSAQKVGEQSWRCKVNEGLNGQWVQLWFSINGRDFDGLPVLKMFTTDFDPKPQDDEVWVSEGGSITIPVEEDGSIAYFSQTLPPANSFLQDNIQYVMMDARERRSIGKIIIHVQPAPPKVEDLESPGIVMIEDERLLRLRDGHPNLRIGYSNDSTTLKVMFSSEGGHVLFQLETEETHNRDMTKDESTEVRVTNNGQICDDLGHCSQSTYGIFVVAVNDPPQVYLSTPRIFASSFDGSSGDNEEFQHSRYVCVENDGIVPGALMHVRLEDDDVHDWRSDLREHSLRVILLVKNGDLHIPFGSLELDYQNRSTTVLSPSSFSYLSSDQSDRSVSEAEVRFSPPNTSGDALNRLNDVLYDGDLSTTTLTMEGTLEDLNILLSDVVICSGRQQLTSQASLEVRDFPEFLW